MRSLIVPGCFLGLFAVVAHDPPARPSPVAVPVPVHISVPGVREPIPLMIDDQPLIRLGSLFPHVADLDADGKPDLLLGTHDRGRMLLARNTGKPGELTFGEPKWFDELNPGVTIPAG